jgi:hypothetical protein
MLVFCQSTSTSNYGRVLSCTFRGILVFSEFEPHGHVPPRTSQTKRVLIELPSLKPAQPLNNALESSSEVSLTGNACLVFSYLLLTGLPLVHFVVLFVCPFFVKSENWKKFPLALARRISFILFRALSAYRSQEAACHHVIGTSTWRCVHIFQFNLTFPSFWTILLSMDLPYIKPVHNGIIAGFGSRLPICHWQGNFEHWFDASAALWDNYNQLHNMV